MTKILLFEFLLRRLSVFMRRSMYPRLELGHYRLFCLKNKENKTQLPSDKQNYKKQGNKSDKSDKKDKSDSKYFWNKFKPYSSNKNNNDDSKCY